MSPFFRVQNLSFDKKLFIITCLSLPGFYFLIGLLTGYGYAGHDSGFLYPGTAMAIIYSLTWIMGLAFFFLFPKDLSILQCLQLIFGMSLVCRMALLLPDLLPGMVLPLSTPSSTAASPLFTLFLVRLWTHPLFDPRLVQGVVFFFDMGVLLLLLQLLHHRLLDLRWAALYGLNPLILNAFTIQGRMDILFLFLLFTAILCHDRHQFGRMTVFLCCALQITYATLLVLPFLVHRKAWRYLPIIVIAGGLLFVQSTWLPLPRDVWTIPPEVSITGTLPGIIRVVCGNAKIAAFLSGLLCTALFTGGLAYYLIKKHQFTDPVQGTFMVLGFICLFSPEPQSACLAWVLPLAAIRSSGTWISLSLFIGTTVAAMHAPGEIPLWALLIPWLPFYLLLWVDAWFFIKRSWCMEKDVIPRTLSVIIPCKNESGRIRKTIQAIQSDPAVSEIIVVDGGSTDTTRDLAAQAGATVLINDHPPHGGGGRGGQIFTGLKAAKGDVAAIVHADTRIVPPVFSRIIDVLSRHPDVIGGAVGNRFDRTGLFMKWIEMMNTFRSLFFLIYFGDQIQFFRRRPVMEKNIFPDIPLMEDVELSVRLNGMGRQLFLFGDAVSSARRWLKKGAPNSLLVVYFVTRYLVERLVSRPDTVAMYRNYYKSPPPEDRSRRS